MNVLGRGVAASASAPIYGNVAINLGGAVSRRTEDEEEHAINTWETYSSSIQYSTTNVASYSFKKTDLKLTHVAKHDLKELAKLIDIHGEDHTDVDEKCVKFFKTYGILGPFNFGGHFWWTCSSKGFSKTQRDTVKKMQSDAISTSSGVTLLVSSEVNMDKTKRRYEGKCTEDKLASTRLQIGGPPEATGISKWKKGLVMYNSTWVLTDRGKKLVAVWDIIKLNHEGEFGRLKKSLRSSWEKNTGLQAERELLESFTYSESVLQQISEWNQREDLSPRQIQTGSNVLEESEKKLLIYVTGALQYWITAYLKDPTLQEFLLSVVNVKPELTSSEHIKLIG